MTIVEKGWIPQRSETVAESDKRHPLTGLLITQFLGAFNDNAWKMLVGLLAMDAVYASFAAGSPEAESASVVQNCIVFLVLTVPLMLFSLPAGVLSDRISKRRVIVAMKVLELVLMAAATVVLFTAPETRWLQWSVLGLMGLQSALFSPAKYGILPELLPHSKLSAGNGALELWTFVAIIAGTAAAGELKDFSTAESLWGPDGGVIWLAPLVLTMFAVMGLFATRWIPPVPVGRASGGLAESVGGAWKAVRAERTLWLAILGYCFYWAIASLMGPVILAFGKSALDLGNPGMLLAVFGLGVGAGSFIAGKMSAGKVEYGLIPLGAIVLAVFTFVLALVPATTTGSFLLMVPLGVASGWIVVPLNALLQWKSPPDRRGAVIALANFLVFGGLIVGNLAGIVLAQVFELPAWGALLAAAILTLAGTAWALWLLPDACLRLILIFLTHTFYRLRVIDARHVPQEGGALLVPNHVSFVDGLFLLASVDRPVRFIVDSAYFKHPFYGPFLRSLKAIEISSSGAPKVILRAMRDAGKYLDEGDVVCIFAEGQITRTGTLQPFRRGLERIVKGRTAPIIPVHLDRVWGSIFSRSGGRFVTKMPRRIPYPVTISFGEPLETKTPIWKVRRAVGELGSAAWKARKSSRPPLHRTFARSARRHPFRLAFADPTRRRMSYLQALVGVIAMARALRPRWRDQEHVGILLPPSIGGALTNIAAAFCGRTTVNLNYTVGREGMESAVRQAGVKTIVTSRAFIEKAKIEVPEGPETLWLEDVRGAIGAFDRLVATAMALLLPGRLIERLLVDRKRPGGPRVANDDTVTVIFSSGSTGEPKGVMLSHFNVDSNVEAVAQVIRLTKDDRILGILPTFHSFGYLALWAAANEGVSIIFLPNPLDAAEVGEKVGQYGVTILIATPTFLQLYLRRCSPGQFGSLRIVLAGAEKLPERLAQAFEDQFGIRPLEGYGTTECAPVIAAGTTDFRAAGFYQPGSRRGSVGQPLPGVAVRIVDADAPENVDECLEPNAPGMLIATGPNVMKGYLGRDELTAEVLRDGWYLTGDIAVMDEDGYIRITDRLSRFAKIGGEMVPHGKVEEALQEAADTDIQVFAVTSIPDERKGEALAVLHTIDEARIPEIVERVGEAGLPNLFVPRVDHFVRVDALPLLGTGKLDLRAVKRLACESLGSSAAAGAGTEKLA